MVERRDQVLIGFRCDPALRDQIEAALAGAPISQFLRDAVVAKLESLNFPVDPQLATAPSRIGKGGPKPRKAAKSKGKGKS